MKKLTKILSVIAIIAILVVSLSVFVSCDKKDKAATEDSTFELVIRKYNGADENYNAKLDGEILAQKTITIKKGQINVSEALADAATNEAGSHKIAFNDTDYILFIDTTVGYSTSWYLTSGSFAAVPEYTDTDFQWSYMAFNGHYSNGVTMDFVDGLTTYTIVIDGYDGTIGS